MSYKSIKTKLHSLYEHSAEDKAELRKLRKILPLIEKALQGKYELVGVIAKGGAGVLFKVNDLNLNVNRALKCARPVAGKEPLLTKILTSEVSKLRGASHQNVVNLFYTSSVVLDGREWPFYIMEYVEGGKDFYQFLQKATIPQTSLIAMLRQFVEGSAYLHSQNMIHGDVKFENALVTPQGRVLISDLGSARYISADRGETMIVFSKPWAHPRVLRGSSESPTDTNRARKETSRDQLNVWMDLYPLGKNILRILNLVDPNDYDTLSPYTRAYLHLMAARLLDGENQSEDELPFGLSKEVLGELKYMELSQVVDDLKKLSGEYPLTSEVLELDEHYPNKIQCSFSRAAAFTPRVQAAISEPVMNRLGEISQLGMLVYIYPTATHTRLEHSLGTYSMAARFCIALWNDPINPFFKQLMTPRRLRATLCAALSHDIGQYGLAHDFEEADKIVFSHTRLTTKLLAGEAEDPICRTFRNVLESIWMVSAKEVAEILDADPNDLDQPILNRLLHTLISGPIDADKADYLIRDSRKMGVSYGEGIDIERLIACLTVTTRPEQKKVFISMGVHENGKIAAESMAFARYALFGSAYWHHTSRSLKSMLHRAIWEALPSVQERVKFENFRGKFENFVFTKVFKQEQLDLFETTKIPHSTQLSVGDLRVLHWLHSVTNHAGKQLVVQILQREVFKRLMVVSHARDIELWNRLHGIRQQFSDSKEFARFQSLFQGLLVKHLVEMDVSKLRKEIPMASFIDRRMITEIQAQDKLNNILVIIDIPMSRPGSTVELQYLSEERIQGRRQIGQTASLEESIVWQAINTRFLESVGKIRIFVHPKYAAYFEVMCPRIILNGALDAAEKKLKSELSDEQKKAPRS